MGVGTLRVSSCFGQDSSGLEEKISFRVGDSDAQSRADEEAGEVGGGGGADTGKQFGPCV